MAHNNRIKKITAASAETETEMVESMEIDTEEAVDITTTRAEDVGMEDAPANNEKEKKKKKKKSKKKKKKKKTKDDGATPGGPIVEATDSTNATAATQGVRAGAESNIYNTRLPDVPIWYYYSEEAKAEV